MSSAKLPLLLIPGLLCDHALWAHQQKALADIAEIRIADTFQDSSIAEMSARAHQQMTDDFPDQRFAVAGLSMGGYVALDMYQQAAERFAKIALLDTRATKESDRQRAQRERLMRTVRFHQRFVGMSDQQLSLYIHPDRVNDTALVTTLREMTQRVGKTVYLRQQQAILSHHSREALLADITVPTLILCGEADAITPVQDSQAMAAKIPHATLAIIEDCGHLSTLERPEIVSDHLRSWLLSSTQS